MLTLSVFYTNYVALCAKQKKSLSAVAEEIGLSRTSPNGWKKGKQPSDVNLQKLADYFGVSVKYLKGEEEQKENPTAQMSSEVSKARQALMQTVLDCPEEDLDRLQTIIQLFLSGNR